MARILLKDKNKLRPLLRDSMSLLDNMMAAWFAARLCNPWLKFHCSYARQPGILHGMCSTVPWGLEFSRLREEQSLWRANLMSITKTPTKDIYDQKSRMTYRRGKWEVHREPTKNRRKKTTWQDWLYNIMKTTHWSALTPTFCIGYINKG